MLFIKNEVVLSDLNKFVVKKNFVYEGKLLDGFKGFLFFMICMKVLYMYYVL